MLNRRELWRATAAIQNQYTNKKPLSLQLPVDEWSQAHDVIRRIERAVSKGWDLAATRLRHELQLAIQTIQLRLKECESPGEADLLARIHSYELAFQMQSDAKEAVDLSQETAATIDKYGLHDKRTAGFGRKCRDESAGRTSGGSTVR